MGVLKDIVAVIILVFLLGCACYLIYDMTSICRQTRKQLKADNDCDSAKVDISNQSIMNTNLAILLRRDTLTNWRDVNPILEYNELVLVVDDEFGANDYYKLGDGVHRFDALPAVSLGTLKKFRVYSHNNKYVEIRLV